jgi:hypothetical protein
MWTRIAFSTMMMVLLIIVTTVFMNFMGIELYLYFPYLLFMGLLLWFYAFL